MTDESLYTQLAEKIGMGDYRIVPRLFELIADADEAELLLALPSTAAGYAAAKGMEEGRVVEMLDILFRKGVVFKKETEKGTLYRMSRDVVQFHDASILWPDAPRAFLDLWQEFMDMEWPVLAEKVDALGMRPVGRVLPVGESIDDKQQILACEDVISIVDGARRIAVTKCTCRLTAGKCDAPIDICLQVDKAADYTVERGTGHEVSHEEARRLVYEAEKAGLIHATMNKAGSLHFICNCCPCCCMVFPLIINRKLKTCDPSRYRAVVSADDCTGCGECFERCYFGALFSDPESGSVTVDGELCMGCGLCHSACPEKAISLVPVRDSSFIPT